MTERIYGLRELTRILTLTPRRAAQLKRLNLLHGQLRDTVRELLALQAAPWFERASEWDADPAPWPDAIDAYRRVVAIDPTYAAAWNNLGLLLHRMGRYDEARAAYDRALAEAGDCAEAAYNLGSLNEDTADVDAAIGCYPRPLEISPDYADPHFNLAGALAR